MSNTLKNILRQINARVCFDIYSTIFFKRFSVKSPKQKNARMFLGQERKNKTLNHNSDILPLTLLRYLPTSCGTCVRLLKPPNAVPFHTLPVTN